MIWPLVSAGVLMLVAAGVHGVIGDSVLRKIGRLDLPANPFGPPADTRVVLRVTWQFGPMAWGALGAWLILAGLQPSAAATPRPHSG